jgi:DHA1 family bicyclomycin/chloramphenicol resistance-like MFS transporter
VTAASQAVTATRPRAKAPPLWLLALITLNGTLAMHIFVPALPQAAHDLHASTGMMQLTLSVYVVGLALGQLTYGPISDRFGRRSVLMFGMIVYALGSLAALVAPTIGLLILARLFQALGGCSGLVLGRAIVRDGAAGNAAARRLSLMNLMTMAGPGLSPMIGAFLVDATGWRSIFALVSLLGLASFALVWRLLPETAGGGANARGVMRNYARLLKSPAFIGYSIGGGCATTAIYAFIAAAPFIFEDQLRQPPSRVGLYLAFNIVGVWLGSLATSRVIGRVPMARLMVMGNLISCVSAAVFLGLVVSGHLTATSAVVTMLVMCFGGGVASPTALTQALSVNPRIPGSASGLYGFVQMIVGAVCSALASVGSNPALSVGMILLAAGLLAQFCFWVALRRRGGSATA